jgi:hypothetical protein
MREKNVCCVSIYYVHKYFVAKKSCDGLNFGKELHVLKRALKKNDPPMRIRMILNLHVKITTKTFKCVLRFVTLASCNLTADAGIALQKSREIGHVSHHHTDSGLRIQYIPTLRFYCILKESSHRICVFGHVMFTFENASQSGPTTYCRNPSCAFAWARGWCRSFMNKLSGSFSRRSRRY